MAHARYFGLRPDEARRRAWQALDLMELTHRATSAIEALSGGMRRRLLIARALLNQPKVLMLDEPTTGLDPHARHLVWQRLRALKQQGATMVLSTHYMDEAANLCDRLAIMEEGRILDQGPPRELVARHAGSEIVELRLAPWNKEQALAKLAGHASRIADSGDALLLLGVNGRLPDLGIDSSAIVRRAPNLEDVFLLLAGKGLDRE
jgi:lipooligosaccharide transport system ATP-binding protein